MMDDAKIAMAIQKEREESPSASERELAVWLSEDFGRNVSRHTIHRVLSKLTLYHRMLAHLERTLPQRRRGADRERSEEILGIAHQSLSDLSRSAPGVETFRLLS